MKSFLILHQDLMISLLGYLAAALGGALAVSGSRMQARAAANPAAPKKQTTLAIQPEAVLPSRPADVREEKTVELLTPNDRRNRHETLTLARDLLAKGASHDRIKRILPVSDGELILLEKAPGRVQKFERGSL